MRTDSNQINCMVIYVVCCARSQWELRIGTNHAIKFDSPPALISLTQWVVCFPISDRPYSLENVLSSILKFVILIHVTVTI